jgi:SAM-dependent methyltransferase
LWKIGEITMKPSKCESETKSREGIDYDREYYVKGYEEQNKIRKILRKMIYKQEWKLIKSNKNYIVDVGCGTGDFLKFSSTDKALGVDLSDFAIKSLLNIDRYGVVADIKHLPFKQDTFDYIIYNDVIEHLEINERDKSLKEVYGILSVGGRIIIRTPNLDRMLRGYKDEPEFVDTGGDSTHKFFYSRDDLKNILRDNGYKIIVSSSDFLLATLFFIPKFMIADFILKLLSKILSPLKNSYGCVLMIGEKQ